MPYFLWLSDSLFETNFSSTYFKLVLMSSSASSLKAYLYDLIAASKSPLRYYADAFFAKTFASFSAPYVTMCFVFAMPLSHSAMAPSNSYISM